MYYYQHFSFDVDDEGGVIFKALIADSHIFIVTMVTNTSLLA